MKTIIIQFKKFFYNDGLLVKKQQCKIQKPRKLLVELHAPFWNDERLVPTGWMFSHDKRDLHDLGTILVRGSAYSGCI